MHIVGAGTLIDGRYRLVRRLGGGGVGTVWLATQELLRGDVAIKFLRDGDATSTRVLREARAASVLRDPHVCRALDVGTHLGLPFIVMEYLDGEDFGALLDEAGSVSVGLAADVVSQACTALGEAHQRGIVHRDVKPENLFLLWDSEGPFVKVVDFGLATDASDDPLAQRLTFGTATFGTPLYIAPEQLRAARDATPASDIWSLGVVLFYACTGRHPVEASELSELLVRISTEPAPLIQSVWADCPAPFAEVVNRCLERNPTDRFASVADLATALAPLVERCKRPGGEFVQRAQESQNQGVPDESARTMHVTAGTFDVCEVSEAGAAVGVEQMGETRTALPVELLPRPLPAPPPPPPPPEAAWRPDGAADSLPVVSQPTPPRQPPTPLRALGALGIGGAIAAAAIFAMRSVSSTGNSTEASSQIPAPPPASVAVSGGVTSFPVRREPEPQRDEALTQDASTRFEADSGHANDAGASSRPFFAPPAFVPRRDRGANAAPILR